MQSKPELVIPDAAQFRQWLQSVLDLLNISAHRLGEISQANKNTARKFVSGEQADMRLAAASQLVNGARRLAAQRGITLPPLPDAASAASVSEPAE